ncbi:hypothetical protein K474DRAFT_1413097 [Panus rudis PR-1116 ss-1]|nr:hypothetical protein K474DRAFT_1413097 [Panus rudis PR-1116 ss-1]
MRNTPIGCLGQSALAMRVGTTVYISNLSKYSTVVNVMSPVSLAVHLSKRTEVVEPPVIAAIVVVIVGFNAAILCMWYIVSERRSGSGQGSALPTARAIVERHPSMAGLRRQLYLDVNSHLYPGCSQGLHIQRSHAARSSIEYKRHNTAKNNADIPGAEVISQTQAASVLAQKTSSSVLTMPSAARLKPRRSFESETASVYSAASAPLNYHIQLFRSQPFRLDLESPSHAPRWIISPDGPFQTDVRHSTSTSSFLVETPSEVVTSPFTFTDSASKSNTPQPHSPSRLSALDSDPSMIRPLETPSLLPTAYIRPDSHTLVPQFTPMVSPARSDLSSISLPSTAPLNIHPRKDKLTSAKLLELFMNTSGGAEGEGKSRETILRSSRPPIVVWKVDA